MNAMIGGESSHGSACVVAALPCIAHVPVERSVSQRLDTGQPTVVLCLWLKSCDCGRAGGRAVHWSGSTTWKALMPFGFIRYYLAKDMATWAD